MTHCNLSLNNYRLISVVSKVGLFLGRLPWKRMCCSLRPEGFDVGSTRAAKVR